MKAQFSLTVPECKRLIAKSIKELESVKKALKNGIVAIGLGSTNAMIVEELLGEKIERERYVAGFIDERGACVVPSPLRLKEVVLRNGNVEKIGINEIVKEMGRNDVFIKGANVLDYEGIAGVMMASETGGTIAQVLGILKARGTKLILPVGLEKLIPNSVTEASNHSGIYQMDYSDGIPVGLMPLSGEVITEIEAFKILTNTDAFLIGSGGLGKATGSKTFLVIGKKEDVRKAIKIVESIKGEKEIRGLRGGCKACAYPQCPKRK
jgi:hypothetical protein